MPHAHELVNANIEYLKQAITLIDSLKDGQYSKNGGDFYQSGVGKHMRHLLDHYTRFLEITDGNIDYDARKRDPKIETDCGYTCNYCEKLIGGFSELPEEAAWIDSSVRIRSNEVEQRNPWSTSTIKRELQFLISHTVHHFALIKIILNTEGIETPREFGIAPSTLAFEKSQATLAEAQG